MFDWVLNKLLIKTFITTMKKLPSSHICISIILKVLILILASLATNAISERGFSALERLHIAFRSTISDLRLNNLIKLHINRDHLTNIVYAANNFFERSEYRKLFLEMPFYI